MLLADEPDIDVVAEAINGLMQSPKQHAMTRA
jgi:hypothetical protein